MDNSLKSIIIAVLAFIAGMFIYSKFFVPEFTTTVIKEITTDTTFQHYKERYQEDSLKWVSLSDSISKIEKKYSSVIIKENIKIVHDSVFVDKPFEAPLRSYKGFKESKYGKTTYDLTVAGYMIDIAFENNFTIPTVTNTITKEVQTVFKPSGLYATIGARAGDSNLSPLVGGAYLKDKAMIFYNYDLKLKSHQAGIGIKVFGK